MSVLDSNVVSKVNRLMDYAGDDDGYVAATVLALFYSTDEEFDQYMGNGYTDDLFERWAERAADDGIEIGEASTSD